MKPVRAKPAEMPIRSCSAIPTWKKRSGKRSAKRWRSVYLPRSAVSPTMRGFRSAARTRAWPKGAVAVAREPEVSLERIVPVTPGAGVVRSVTGGLQFLPGEVPLAGLDSDEVVLLAALERRHAFPQQGVEDDGVGPALVELRALEGFHDRPAVVPGDPDRVPAEGRPLVLDRLDPHDLRRRPVGLLLVAIDEEVEVVERVVGRRLRGFPRGPFLELSVGDESEEARREAVEADPKRHADGLRKALAERAAGHLEAGGPLAPRHFQARSVGAVGVQLLQRE